MNRNVFGCFLAGIGAGVGIGMLVAPREGGQMRGRIRSKADESAAYLKQRSRALRDSAAGMVDKVKQSSTDRRMDQEALQRMDGEGGPDRTV